MANVQTPETDVRLLDQSAFQFPNWIRETWNTVRFRFPQKDGTFLVQQIETEEKHKIQFLFSVRNIADAFKLEFENRGFKITDKTPPGCFTVTSNKCSPDDFMKLVKKRCIGIVTFNVVISSEENEYVFKNIQSSTPSMVSKGNAMLMRENGLLVCVADDKVVLNQTLMDLGYTDIETIDISSFQENIKYLNIENSCAYLHPFLRNVRVDLGKEICIFSWWGGRHENGMDLVKQFLEKCQRTELEFKSNDIWTEYASNLIFPETGITNNAFLDYIKSKCTKKGLPTHFNLIKDKKGQIVLVQPPQGRAELSAIIQQSLHFHRLSKARTESEELNQCFLQNENKLWFDKQQGVVVCFDNLSSHITSIVSSVVSLPTKVSRTVTGDEFNMLPLFIRELSMDLAFRCRTLFGVDLRILSENVVLEGSDATQIDKCLKFIIKEYSSRRMLVVVEENVFELCKSELQHVLDLHSCRWTCQTMNKTKGATEVLADFHDMYGKTNFRLKEDGSEIRTDILVELTNEHYVPLSIKHPSKGYPSFAKIGPNKKVIIGSVYMHQSSLVNEGRIQCKEIWFIWCTQAHNKTIEVITSDQLTDAFSTVFANAIERKYMNICTRVSLDESVHGRLPETEIVRSLVLASCKQSSHNEPSVHRTLEIHLLKGAIGKTANTLTEEFMKIYNAFVKIPRMFYSEDRAIKIQVKIGTIQNEKVDIIVCTQSTSLDFKGQCAKEIKHAAGHAIVTECLKKYPKGIEYCTVGYTSSCDLSSKGVKFIFHTALPDYNAEYMQQVHQVVRNCLITAEEHFCESIAFPALGVGKLEYPCRETAFQMFESIDEYTKQNPATTLKKVTIVTFKGDASTCKAFRNEEYRRSKKCMMVQPASTCTKEHNDARIFQMVKRNISMRVVEHKNATFPVYAVEVIYESDGTDCKIKCAMEPTAKCNDQIKVRLNQMGLQKILYQLRSTLEDERVTHLIWNIDKTSKTAHGAQVNLIVDMIESMCNKQDLKYLRVVDIIVPDESGFASFSSQADRSKWQLITVNDKRECIVELIAKSKDDLMRARNSMAKVLHDMQPNSNIDKNEPSNATEISLHKRVLASETIMPSEGQIKLHFSTIVATFSARVSEEEEKPTTMHIEKSDSKTDAAVESVLASKDSASATSHTKEYEGYELSAVINPGITSYLQGGLSKWISSMERIYNVKICCKDSRHTVYGNIDNVIAFEQYLDNNFPDIATTV